MLLLQNPKADFNFGKPLEISVSLICKNFCALLSKDVAIFLLKSYAVIQLASYNPHATGNPVNSCLTSTMDNSSWCFLQFFLLLCIKVISMKKILTVSSHFCGFDIFPVDVDERYHISKQLNEIIRNDVISVLICFPR